VPFTNVDTDDDIQVWSVGAEYEIEPDERLGVVLGYGHAFLEGDEGVQDDGSIVLGGVTYTFPTDTQVRGSVAHKIRMPSVLQLYDPESGNTDLDAEKCWCFEVAVEQQLPYASSIAVAGFWQELRNFIERDSSRIFQNVQKLRLRGVEVSAASRPFEPLELRFAYAYLDTDDRSDNANFSKLASRPAHTIDFTAQYEHPWDGSLRVGVRHIKGIQADSRNSPYTLKTIGAFTTVDARIGQNFWQDRVELYVGVDNIFDAEGEVNVGFPNPGRTVLGGGSVRF
jgi:outer membrane cobalamin receptor